MAGDFQQHFIQNYDSLRLQTMRRTPAGEDWARFIYYADKVRELTIKGGQGQAHEEAMGLLGVCRPRMVLFPHLRKLRWHQLNTSLPYLQLFVAPGVQKFWFEYRAQEHGAAAFVYGAIAATATVLTRLRELRVDARLPPTDETRALFAAALSTLVCASNTLEEVICPRHELGPVALLHLGRCSSMNKLESKDQLDYLGAGAAHEGDLFPMLATLVARAGIAELMPRAFKAIGSARLEYVEIQSLDSSLRVDAFLPLARTLAAHPSALALTSLKLNLGDVENVEHVPEDDQHEYKLTLEHVRELFALRRLENFTLDAPYLYADDDLLLALPDHWPRLIGLTLGGVLQPAQRILDATPGCSLRTIGKLFARCRHLVELNVLIDVELSLIADSPPPVEWGLRMLESEPVRLGFLYSTITPEQAHPLAERLSALFPGVEIELETSQCLFAFSSIAEQEQLPPNLEFEDVFNEGERRSVEWRRVEERLKEIWSEYPRSIFTLSQLRLEQ
jgi:hypothetical protein